MNNKIMAEAEVRKKYNVAPEKLNDLFALMGDKADNVPGVPGIGPKTAEKLINEYGSLAGLFTNLDRLKKSKLKENLNTFKDQAFLSQKLIHLKDDLTVPNRAEAYILPEPDQKKLQKIYAELEFSRLLKSTGQAEKISHAGFQLVVNDDDLHVLGQELEKAKILVVDTETTSVDALRCNLVGLSFCTNTKTAFYIPLAHCREDLSLLPGQLSLEKIKQVLCPFLANPDLAKLAHNIKFDYQVLKRHGLPLAGNLLDSMIASYLLDPSRRSHKLDDLSREYLDLELTAFAEVTGKDKRDAPFAFVDLEDAGAYSCEDVRAALLLWQKFEPRLKEFDLWELFTEVEMKIAPLLAKMEENGIRVDPQTLEQLSSEFAGQIKELAEKIFSLAGETFNVNSPKQLGVILFDKLGLPHGRKTKTGYSTNIKVLEKLSAYHELPGLVISYRNLAKLKSSFVDNLTVLINPETGRIHSSFNQTITATGRLSSSKPNLQNIPVRSEEGQRIREAFIPETGCLFLAADYSQIDLRVLAHYSRDEALLEAFHNNRDVHTLTAAEIFRVNPGFVTPQMRRVAKTINFGIVYGMSAFGLAAQLNISRNEAQTFIDRYFEHYSGVKKFMNDIIRQAGEDGYVTTLLKRRRLLPDIKSSNRNRREFAERTAINTPIQGTAADIIKLATIKVDELLTTDYPEVKIILQIHDELIFEAPEDIIETISAPIKTAMESALEIDVPLVVNLAKGNNLAKA
jgi:DNA polymerase-1